MFPFRRSAPLEKLDQRLVFSKRKIIFPRFSQWQGLPQLLNSRERWILRIAGGILVVASGVLGLVLLRPHFVRIARPGGTYQEALIGSPRLINPLLAYTDADRDLVRLLYSGLLRYNTQGQLEGDLALRYTVSDDGKEIQFTLKEGLRFHDGEPLTSADVVFTLKAAQNPAWHSPLAASFQNLTIKTPDARTILISSKKPVLSALLPVWTVGILPQHLWEEVDPVRAERAIWNIKPVGSGPFRFQAIIQMPDGTIVAYKLTRNADYHGGAPYLSELILRFVPDFESALGLLKDRKVEGVSIVPASFSAAVTAPVAQTHALVLPYFTGLFFQERKNSALAEKDVRQALMLALNYEEIVKLVPTSQRAATPFLPEILGLEQIAPAPQFQPQEAQKKLQTAGWVLEKGKRLKKGLPLIVTLTTINDPLYLSVAEQLKKSWENLGLTIKLEAVAKNDLASEVLRPRRYEILLFSVVGTGDPDPYPLWHSAERDDPGLNLSSLKFAKLDALIEKSRTLRNPEQRLPLYQSFQEAFLEEVPAILLYRLPYTYAIALQLRGFTQKIITVPADRFNGIEKWFKRTRLVWKKPA